MPSLDQRINHIGLKEGGHVSFTTFSSYLNKTNLRAFLVLSATILTAINILSTKTTMKMIAFFTIIKISVLLLITCIGILVLTKAIPSDVDASLNLSFFGTSNTVGPYASALYYVMNSYSGWHNLNYIIDEVKVQIIIAKRLIYILKIQRRIQLEIYQRHRLLLFSLLQHYTS
jgi:amino acid transporter